MSRIPQWIDVISVLLVSEILNHLQAMFSQFVVVASIGGELENKRDNPLYMVAKTVACLTTDRAHGLQRER